ncbi:MAG: methylenetetrahydrofolate reductase [Clostridiales bacterium]|nr:methylenetetrahydrofolate reductase [Clostridiales bacterium]
MMSEKSRLQKLFEAGKFVVTTEIGPPMSADAENVRVKAREISGKVDAANVTDCQTSIVRMSSIAAAVIAQSEGVETIMQMTCRDRNRIAIQSDILGAYALGLKNILCLSGDHQSFGNDPQSKNVYDIDSIQLTQAVASMANEGKFINGKSCKTPAEFFVGATVNPFADPEDIQILRLQKKINAGARFIQTQAVYDVDRFEAFMEKVRRKGLHEKAYIQAGILVNKSLRSIEMTAQVPGMAIPEELIARMRDADDKQAEGLKIALELIAKLKTIPGISGIHIMAVGWESIVPELVGQAGFLPRPEI